MALRAGPVEMGALLGLRDGFGCGWGLWGVRLGVFGVMRGCRGTRGTRRAGGVLWSSRPGMTGRRHLGNPFMCVGAVAGCRVGAIAWDRVGAVADRRSCRDRYRMSDRGRSQKLRWGRYTNTRVLKEGCHLCIIRKFGYKQGRHTFAESSNTNDRA